MPRVHVPDEFAADPSSYVWGMVPEIAGTIGIGSVVGFFVALVVVKAFVEIITRVGFAPFAWYRIVAGSLGLAWLTFG